MSTRYQQTFKKLEQQQAIAWIPFMMLGFPTLDSSVELIKTLIDNGADALELGIPFSDPIADGKMVQIAAQKALEQKVSVADCLMAIERIREYSPETPIGLLTYSNLVYSPGINEFYRRCSEIGVDSVLIADVPLSEIKQFQTSANAHGIDSVLIAPPNADQQTVEQISQHSQGYTYMVSRPGVTGDNTEVAYPTGVLKALLEAQAAPPVLGFGISKPEHVTKAKQLGFKGVIAGSAVIRVIEQYLEEHEVNALQIKKEHSSCELSSESKHLAAIQQSLAEYLSLMKAAC